MIVNSPQVRPKRDREFGEHPMNYPTYTFLGTRVVPFTCRSPSLGHHRPNTAGFLVCRLLGLQAFFLHILLSIRNFSREGTIQLMRVCRTCIISLVSDQNLPNKVAQATHPRPQLDKAEQRFKARSQARAPFRACSK